MLATEATALLHGREEAAHARPRGALEEGAAEPCRRSRSARAAQRVSACWPPAWKSARVVERRGAPQHQGAAGSWVNDETVTDEKMVLTPAHLTREGVIKLSLGRKRHVLLKPL